MNIVFDIGGTHMRVAATSDHLVFSRPVVVDTPQDFDQAVELLRSTILLVSGNEPIETIAGGLAGVIDSRNDTIFYSPHLTQWQGKSLKRALSDLGEVYIENDAALVGLGEAVFGAGTDAKIVAYVTISTGIGGARIVHQHIDVRYAGFEPGQQIIDVAHGRSLEALASGAGIQSQYHILPKEITDQAVWDRAARDLATGIFNMIVHWSPTVVILGGPMILKKPGIAVETVEKYLEKMNRVYPVLPELRLAKLEDDGGLYGAMEYLRQKTT